MTLEITFRHLRCFIVLAQELHFGRAAKRLEMAQPHLSTLIRRMEASIGTALLHRTPRVELTPAGEAFLESARRTLAEADYGLERARRAGRSEGGILSVGVASTVLLTRLPETLLAYRKRHPLIKLRLQEMHSAAQLEALQAGVLDIGLLRQGGEEAQSAPDDGLVRRVLSREGFVAVLPATHRLAQRARVPLAMLAREEFVLPARAVAPGVRQQLLALFAKATFAPAIAQEANEWHSLVALVGAGFGVAVAPACVRRIGMKGVRYVALAEGRRAATLVLCWSRHHTSAAIHGFIEFLGQPAAQL